MDQSSWLRAVSLVADARIGRNLDKNGLPPLDKLSTIKYAINLYNN